MRRLLAAMLMCLCAPLAGCRHRAPKPLAIAPAPPVIAPVMVSVPPPTHPTEPLPAPVTEVKVTPVPPAAAPRKPRRKRSASAAAPPASPPALVAGNTAPPVAPPAATGIEIGQLSTGGEAGAGLRIETEQLVDAQRQRMEHISPALVAAHGTEVEQARRFLKSAEDAWKAADVEGAHTLASKTKVLLDDLEK